MRSVKINELDITKFMPFGYYASLINPSNTKIGEKPIEFYRDILQEELGNASRVSFSICRVEKRPYIIDTIEYHTSTGEGILPLDEDVLIHVGVATPHEQLPLNDIEVFKIPKGTMVVLRPGVWHHAPFTLTNNSANVLIILPERTYANDCEVVQLQGNDRIAIDL